MFSFSSSGDLSDTERFLESLRDGDIFQNLSHYGQMGVNALASVTPVDTTYSASQWGYRIENDGESWSITWTNSSMGGNTPVVILLQYGHGTGTGGYVQGVDFINPAIKPIFDQILEDAWKAVTSA